MNQRYQKDSTQSFFTDYHVEMDSILFHEIQPPHQPPTKHQNMQNSQKHSRAWFICNFKMYLGGPVCITE